MCGSQALTSALEATTAQDLGEGLGGVCAGVRWPGMSQNPSKGTVGDPSCFGTIQGAEKRSEGVWNQRPAERVGKGCGALALGRSRCRKSEQLCGSGCSVLWDHAGAVELWGSEQMSGSGCSGTIQALTSALEASEVGLGRHRLA